MQLKEKFKNQPSFIVPAEKKQKNGSVTRSVSAKVFEALGRDGALDSSFAHYFEGWNIEEPKPVKEFTVSPELKGKAKTDYVKQMQDLGYKLVEKK